MYTFYKLINGKEKAVHTFNSTLDPTYHEYINWCRQNNISWVVRDANGNIKFKSNG
jgi:hypothetical protein